MDEAQVADSITSAIVVRRGTPLRGEGSWHTQHLEQESLTKHGGTHLCRLPTGEQLRSLGCKLCCGGLQRPLPFKKLLQFGCLPFRCALILPRQILQLKQAPAAGRQTAGRANTQPSALPNSLTDGGL